MWQNHSQFRMSTLSTCSGLTFNSNGKYPPSILAKLEKAGSGDGTAKNSRIQSMIRWDLFEKQDENLCCSKLIGVIETHNGAQI